MRIGRTLLAALAAFVVFGPATFLWHTVLFIDHYIGPTFSVKSPDNLSPASLAAAIAVLMLGMAIFVPPMLKATGRLRDGALLGSLFASVGINFHSLFLNGLFPGADPASLYLFDAAWALIFGAVAGAIVVLVHDKLGGAPAAMKATPKA